MTLVFPHNIVNGTLPDADEVMGNFQAVKSEVDALDVAAARKADFRLVSKEGSGSTAKRTTVGTSTAQIANSAASITVTKASQLKIDFSSKLTANANDRASFQAGLYVMLNGAAIPGADVVLTWNDAGISSSYPAWATNHVWPICGTAILALPVGTHTVALQATVTVGSALGTNFNIEFSGGRWTGVVMPT